MNAFAQYLRQLRIHLGYKSGAAFHKEMSRRGLIDLNYPNYKKIETGQTFPRSDFVRRLAQGLSEQSEDLIKSYCRAQFPEHTQIFTNDFFNSPTPDSSVSSPMLFKQNELSNRQVAVIAKSPDHYALYLLVSIARRPVTIIELEQVFQKKVELIIEDLLDAKLMYRDSEGVKGISVEYRFPSPDSNDLKKTYARLDEWDLALQHRLHLKPLLKKTLFRRVSPRYIPVIQSFVDALLTQVRASDESDLSKNNEILYFSIDLSHGKLPG